MYVKLGYWTPKCYKSNARKEQWNAEEMELGITSRDRNGNTWMRSMAKRVGRQRYNGEWRDKNDNGWVTWLKYWTNLDKTSDGMVPKRMSKSKRKSDLFFIFQCLNRYRTLTIMFVMIILLSQIFSQIHLLPGPLLLQILPWIIRCNKYAQIMGV